MSSLINKSQLFFSSFLNDKSKALESLDYIDIESNEFVYLEKEKLKNQLLCPHENFYGISSAFDSSTNSIIEDATELNLQ